MATSEGSGSQIRLGVSPLSWTNDVLAELGGDVPLEVCLRDAAEIGYQGVELGRKFPRTSRELQPKLSSYGLQLATGWHSGFLSERSVEAEWKAAADHVRLLEDCGCQVLVYGECGMLEGDSPWDEPLSRKTPLQSIDLAAYAEKLGEFSAGLNQLNSAVKEGVFTVPGDGCLDFSEIGQFIRSSGYHGWVIVEAEQDPAKAEPRLYTGKAYQYVKDRLW